MKELNDVAERVAMLYKGRTVAEIMKDAEADEERGMLHMVLETIGHDGPSGMMALSASHGHPGREKRDWLMGLLAYRENYNFRWHYTRIVNQLSDAIEAH